MTEIEKFLDDGLNWKGDGILQSMQRMVLHFGSKPKGFEMPKTDYPAGPNKRNLPKLMLVKRHKTPPKEALSAIEPLIVNEAVSQRKRQEFEKLSKVQNGITVREAMQMAGQIDAKQISDYGDGTLSKAVREQREKLVVNLFDQSQSAMTGNLSGREHTQQHATSVSHNDVNLSLTSFRDTSQDRS
jgi:hypothetical protein